MRIIISMEKLCKKQEEMRITGLFRRGAPFVTHQAPRFPQFPTGARPKNEQNFIHSELKAIPDRFTPYSRFREIYNGKRCYRICARDVCVGHRRCLPLFSSSSFEEAHSARKKRACREKRVCKLKS